LNNPLKYIDPTGRAVQIGNSYYNDSTGGGSPISPKKEDMELIETWLRLREVAPELSQALINDEQVVKICGYNFPDGLFGLTTPATEKDPVTIYISTTNLQLNHTSRIAVLGHELFHALCRFNGMEGSRLEEAYARNYEAIIYSKLDKWIGALFYYYFWVSLDGTFDNLYPGTLNQDLDNRLNQGDLANSDYQSIQKYPVDPGAVQALYVQYYPN